MKLMPPPLSREERLEVQGRILAISAPRRSFCVLVVLSTTIASYGLLANSSAVVIGAMLIAPLMGPILGIALALCQDNRRLLGLAALSEILGVVVAISIGFGIGLVPLRPEFGPEILGRTQPTVYDILIALASGLAGAYALVNPKLNPTLAGVAIATALVPPLATCGLCLSAGEWRFASGAFLLFFANFLSIEIAAAVVFSVAGLGTNEGGEKRALTLVTRRFRGSLLLLCAVAVFMTHTLKQIVEERRTSSRIESALRRELGATAGARLSAVHLTRQGDTTRVIADVLTPQAFDPVQVTGLEDRLQEELRMRLHLVVRSLIAKDADRNGAVFLPVTDTRQRAKAEDAALLQTISQQVEQALETLPGARLVDLRREVSDSGTLTVTAVVRTASAIDPAGVGAIQARLIAVLGQEVRLVVRSVLTRDADADHFLYQATREERGLTDAEAHLRGRLEEALGRLLPAAVAGTSLTELTIERTNGRLELLATVRAPRNLDPVHVLPIQATLRRYVDPRIELVVRSLVGTDSAADGYRVPRLAERTRAAAPGARQ